jgi:hypothetical protein
VDIRTTVTDVIFRTLRFFVMLDLKSVNNTSQRLSY